MENKKQILICAGFLAIGFFLGTYLTPDKKETLSTTSEKTANINTKEKVKKVTKETITKDGTVTRVIEEDAETTIAENRKEKDKLNYQLIENKRDLYIGAMSGYIFNSTTIVYGAQAHKEILGNFSVGVFLLTNKTAGATIGLSL